MRTKRRSGAYDDVADWYAAYVTGAAGAFTSRAGDALSTALGEGRGFCWDAACGTGVYAGLIGSLGWTWLGSDLSAAQLRHVPGTLPVAVADATQPPFRAGTLAAVALVLCHTDVEDYAALCRAAASALTAGGRFVHVGVHPCFCGAFVDRSSQEGLVIHPGYWSGARRFDAWSPDGVRARVGATHLPLSELVAAVTDAGLVIDKVIEQGAPTPDVLAIRAHLPAGGTAGT